MIHFDATLWVAIAFVIFVALAFKPVARILTGGLDNRTNRIKDELDEAIRLKEEAQAILASYQRKQKEVMQEAELIVTRAQEDAKRLVKDAQEELEATLSKRIEMTMNKISTYEATILQDVRNHAIDAAIEKVNSLIDERMDSATADALVTASIEEIDKKLH